MNVADLITFTLPELDKQNSEEELGDRTKYIGGSDMNLVCPRHILMQKLDPSDHDIETHLRFQRGRYWEQMISVVLEANDVNFEREVEVVHPDDERLVAHLDYVIINDEEKYMYYKEAKAPGYRIYDSKWDNQLQWGMNLLHLNYPDYTIFGNCIINDGTVFEFPTQQPNEKWFENMVTKAQHVLDGIENSNEVRCEYDPAQCAFCNYHDDCPIFGNKEEFFQVTEGDPFLELFNQREFLSREIKELMNEKDDVEAKIKPFLENVGITVETPDQFIKLLHSQSRKFSGPVLKEKYPKIYEECRVPQESMRLSVRQKKEKKASKKKSAA